MDKQNLMPQLAQPINRITTGQLPAELAQLSEEALSQQADASISASVLAQYISAAQSSWLLRTKPRTH
jgi:bacteriocin leader peptide (microcyclamide/patellamide family)